MGNYISTYRDVKDSEKNHRYLLKQRQRDYLNQQEERRLQQEKYNMMVVEKNRIQFVSFQIKRFIKTAITLNATCYTDTLTLFSDGQDVDKYPVYFVKEVKDIWINMFSEVYSFFGKYGYIIKLQKFDQNEKVYKSISPNLPGFAYISPYHNISLRVYWKKKKISVDSTDVADFSNRDDNFSKNADTISVSSDLINNYSDSSNAKSLYSSCQDKNNCINTNFLYND